MTYFGFLGLFLLPLLLILLGITISDMKGQRRMPENLAAWPVQRVILAHVLVALLYTTPWDNYLVATGVWWYDPELVTGVTIGWVPIEEYTFFILQTTMVGLWFGLAARRLKYLRSEVIERPKLRIWLTLVIIPFWLGAAYSLATGWQPGNYLALILIWALPPIMVQTFFGGDILWHHRRLVVAVILISTAYLGIADSVAINAGTWTISPAQTLGLYLGGILPVEELLFFFVTNILIGFGMTLVLAKESQQRVPPAVLNRIATIFGLRGMKSPRTTS
jgi:lycopene beta-cyclase